MAFAFDTSRYSGEQLQLFNEIMRDYNNTFSYGTKEMPISKTDRDLINVLSDAGFNIDFLERVTEDTLRNLFLTVFGGKYGGGSGKNKEIIEFQQANAAAKRNGTTLPSKDLDPTDGVHVLKK